MNMEEGYFFDTYAFFEILRKNPDYERFRNARIATTIFNLAELNFGLKKELPATLADKYTEEYWQFIVEVTLEDVQQAMNLKNKYKHMSIPDAIGYTIAKKLGIKFLTGDNDFKEMRNVEFVK